MDKNVTVASPSLDSTYGVWLVSIFLETILYGFAFLQTILYFEWAPDRDSEWRIKCCVLSVFFCESFQILLFFRSIFFRFVYKFGEIQADLIWSDSVQLLANYLTAFAVQIYFASRIYNLRKEGSKLYASNTSAAFVAIIILAFVQVSAGCAQTIWSYLLHSFGKLDQTKAVTTLQIAASSACDICITIYLCSYLARCKTGMKSTDMVVKTLFVNAVNRGILMSLTSASTIILFFVLPDTFWFFLSLAPNSKIYINSMLATLNMRRHLRNRLVHGNDAVHDLSARSSRPSSALEFVRPPYPMDFGDQMTVPESGTKFGTQWVSGTLSVV